MASGVTKPFDNGLCLVIEVGAGAHCVHELPCFDFFRKYESRHK